MLNTQLASIAAILRYCAFWVLLVGTMWGQQPGSLKGTVADESGAVIPDATIEVLQGQRVVQSAHSDALGKFVVAGLGDGQYCVRVKADGFQDFKSDWQKLSGEGEVRFAITLKILTAMEQVTVTSDQSGGVGLESADNATAVVLRGADLDVLPDDSEELLADLQALSGPPVGSGGSQLYLDGFSGSRVPPKNAIREVRINQDPFSAQYDHAGFSRVEILTKPGAEKIHGTLQFKMSDAAMNSRNPFTSIKAPYQSKHFTGDLGGPLSKRASFFLNFEGRWATDNEVVDATILDPSLHITPLTQAELMPDREHSAGGRIDYKLNEKHNLTGRYQWDHSQEQNAGVGGFALPSRAYATSNTAHTFQLTENAILSSTALNQTRFQFVRTTLTQQATSFAPTIQVLDAFTSGGAQVGNSQHVEDLLELQNYMTKTWGSHTLTFGGQFHRDAVYDRSPGNFGGTFVFSGGLAPELNSSNQIVLNGNGNPIMSSLSSIQRYQRTLQLLQVGFSPTEVIALGGGASQFSIAAGQPVSAFTQSDVGLFLQENWHANSHLSINAGFRWEGQNDIHDWKDFAPRFGLAWMPGGKSRRTVIRLGAGIFYDRFPAAEILQTLRFNGRTQQQYVLNNPAFYPQVPSITSLEAMGVAQTIRTLNPNLRAPYLMQASAGLEHEMPLGMLVSLNYIGSWGRHQLVSENVAANSGPAAANYRYVSAGALNLNQFIASVRRPFHNGFAVFGRYEYNRAFGNTDGVNTFPANQSNLQADYGRAATDIRHTLVLGGSLPGPFGTSLNAFLVVRSGAPFNITTGHDNNGDTLFTDRPAFASASQPGAIVTPFGIFNPFPGSGSAVIPHNYGQGPGFAMLNLRLSRTFGFGAVAGDGSSKRVVPALAGSRLFAAPSTNHHYNVTVEIIVRNLLNTTNPGIPVGNLSSPSFGRSNWLASTAGPADIAFGNNRRVQFQLRFDF